MARRWLVAGLLVGILAGCGPVWAAAQGEAGAAAGCVLTDHVYRCDGAAFQRVLASANTVSVETHNVDGFARDQLTKMLTGKLGKTIASAGNPPELIFLMIPIADEGGITRDGGDVDLGTLRVYSAGPGGAHGSLLWAETFSNTYVPWPAVVHGLILQFQSHFHIK